MSVSHYTYELKNHYRYITDLVYVGTVFATTYCLTALVQVELALNTHIIQPDTNNTLLHPDESQ